MLTSFALIAAGVLTFSAQTGSAQSGAPSAPSPGSAQEDPAHQELRAVRDGILSAMKAHDLDRLLTFIHPNVVVTWQNAEVSRGRQGFADYYKRMMSGPESIVQGLDMDTQVDELSILYGGDTAISFGSSKDHFELRAGPDFELATRWSATLVKDAGHWLVASLHASANLFDNALIQRVERMIPYAAAAALALGGLLGFLLGRRRRAGA